MKKVSLSSSLVKIGLLIILVLGMLHVTAQNPLITLVAGTGVQSETGYPVYNGDSLNAKQTDLYYPSYTFSNNADEYVFDHENGVIRKIDPTGLMTIIYGKGDLFAAPYYGVIGNNYLYFTDNSYNTVNALNLSTGTVSILFSGFNCPTQICWDSKHNLLYVANSLNYEVDRINLSDTTISIVAGANGELGYASNPPGDFQPNGPMGVCVAPSGDVYIADNFNHLVKKIDFQTGQLSTVAGGGIEQSNSNRGIGDGGPPLEACIGDIRGLCISITGDTLCYADETFERVQMIIFSQNIIATVAGTGIADTVGNGRPAINAALYYPEGVAMSNDTLYITTAGGGIVQEVILTNVVLPVTFTSFTAVPSSNGKAVNTAWTTVAQINNKEFTVEKSIDGVAWDKVGQVDGCGTCATTESYQLTDNTPFTGLSYYRVTQIDNDGDSSYSDIVAVVINTPETFITAYPNPTNGPVLIQGTKGSSIKIVDIQGKQIQYDTISSTDESARINIAGVAAGIYFLEVINQENTRKTLKIIKE